MGMPAVFRSLSTESLPSLTRYGQGYILDMNRLAEDLSACAISAVVAVEQLLARHFPEPK